MRVSDLIEKLQQEWPEAIVRIQFESVDETTGEFFLTDAPLGTVVAENHGRLVMLLEGDDD